jgi:four helix bundle protein
LVIEVYRRTNRFPVAERYGLTSQLRRGAVSVAANIVEGAARKGQREFDRFLEMSFGSAREVGYYIDLSAELGYLDAASAERLRSLQRRAASALGNLICSRARPHTSNPRSPPTAPNRPQ